MTSKNLSRLDIHTILHSKDTHGTILAGMPKQKLWLLLPTDPRMSLILEGRKHLSQSLRLHVIKRTLRTLLPNSCYHIFSSNNSQTAKSHLQFLCILSPAALCTKHPRRCTLCVQSIQKPFSSTLLKVKEIISMQCHNGPPFSHSRNTPT